MKTTANSRQAGRPGTRSALARTTLRALALALGVAACADEPTRPATGGENPPDGGRTPSRTLGLVEITISGLGTDRVTSSALSAPTVAELDRLRALRDAGGAEAAGPGSLTPQAVTLPDHTGGGGDGTLQLELLATGSFTDGARGSGGYRYLWATYRVRNAQKDGTAYDTPRQNLTLYAVDTDGTIGETAISQLELFDGTPADPAIANQLLPTGAVAKYPGSNTIEATDPDVLQLVTETVADAVEAAASPSSAVVDVFPYGFVVRNATNPNDRTLAANPAPDQFDGIVTFAFKVPLQATPAADPFTVSFVFLATDDDEVRITQSLEEQSAAGTAAFEARAAALGASSLTLLPPGPSTFRGHPGAQMLCEVRIAGPASNPTTTLFPAPGNKVWLVAAPLPGGNSYLAPDVRMTAAGCPSISTADSTTFAVHGYQSGRASGMYTGVGTSLVVAPTGPGGAFVAGEEVEVTLTSALGATQPIVARYRVAASGGSGVFAVVGYPDVGTSPRGIVAADLDGDNDLDLAVARLDGHDVKILRNGGPGSFSVVDSVAVGQRPIGIVAADLDGDGDIDLATANSAENTVTILLNNGSGTFTSAGSVATEQDPVWIAAADLDGDGDIDLATANSIANTVTILLNNGSGSFTSAGSVATGTRPQGIVAADLDGDGDMDLATASSASDSVPGMVTILRNNGSGSFTSAGSVATGNGAQAIVAADLDGDGDIDLATANSVASTVTILRNDGSGSFTATGSIALGGNAASLVAADLDGDGDLDLAVPLTYNHRVQIYRNDGAGTFASSSPAYLAANTYPSMIVAADLDRDGDIDVATSNGNSSTISVLRNQ
jgi:hypothetical protein